MRKALSTTRKSTWLILSLLLVVFVAVGIMLVPKRALGEADDGAGEGVHADVSLNETQESDGERFIARQDLVYSGAEYRMDELNSLLHVSGDAITPAMTASVVGYTDPYGIAAPAQNLPQTICDAGSYLICVDDGGTQYTFTVNIARAKIDLGNYSNLSWRLTNVGGAETNTELLNGAGVLLYIYTDPLGKEYPSETVLSAEQISELGLSTEYKIKTVMYSVVRNRYNSVVVSLSDSAAYTVEYERGTNTANTTGRYDAEATLTATKNYTFTLSDVTALRGISINVSENKMTAIVRKTWYIVDMNNWLVGSTGEDYAIADRVFGQETPVAAPKLRYGSDSDISMRLMRNGTQIGSDSFGVADFDKYINKVMPEGDYRLIVTAAGVYSEEVDNAATTDPEHPVKVTLYRSGFTESVAFSVDKATLPSLSEINAAVKGKTFMHEWAENAPHLYDNAAQELIDEYLSNHAVERDGTVWENYDALYNDDFSIMFNLARMQSDAYYAATDMTVSTADSDRYTVYYMISSLNYYSSIENLDYGDVRQNYYFEVVNVRAVDIPNIAAKDYNGEVQTADIADGLYYTVAANAGGTEVGKYNVVLSLRDPDCYMWRGQTPDNKTESITVSFDINKSHNQWVVEPTLQNWVEGRFDVDDNALIGSALFGYDDLTFIVTDTSQNRRVLFDSTYDDISVLNSIDAGEYFIRVNIAETESYSGLSHSMLFSVFKSPGIPGWGIFLIVLAVLAVIAAVLLVLWKKGIFRILTGRLIVAIRTKATVDATIAAVRASKKAEELRLKELEAKQRQLEIAGADNARQDALPAGQDDAAEVKPELEKPVPEATEPEPAAQAAATETAKPESETTATTEPATERSAPPKTSKAKTTSTKRRQNNKPKQNK